MSSGVLAVAQELRRWMGPLGRYRPGLFRKDLTEGFRNCDMWSLPTWARVLRCSSTAEEKLLETLQIRGQIVYDVGAFNGTYSLFFSRRVGASGRVIAFEPRAESFATLLANLQRNHITNVLPLHLGLGAEAGVRRLFMLPGMPTTASMSPEAQTPLRLATGEAKVETLDQLVETVPLPPPNLIKVDVEGLEMEVLQGSSRTLAQHLPDLLIEVHGDSGKHKAERIEALCRMLRPLGYSLLHAESGRKLAAAAPLAISSGHIFAHAAL
ncbi:MAG: FkbM family methyltransferase [Terriglobales bacterium]